MSRFTRAIPPTGPINGKPAWIHLERTPHALRLRFRWWTREGLLPAWLGPTSLVLARGMLQSPEGLASWLAALVFAGVGLPLTLWAIAWLLNSTTIEITPERIRARHGTVPLLKSADLTVPQVLGLYQEFSRRGVRLLAAMENGERIPLTPWFYTDRARQGAAGFIERTMEEFLGIANRAIVCPNCGYDLRSTPKRCPECGRRFRKGRMVQ